MALDNDLATLKALAPRVGNKILHATIAQKAPTVRALKKTPAEGLGVINVKNGTHGGVGIVGDGTAVPSAGRGKADQILVRPVAFFANVVVPQLTASMLKGRLDSVDYYKEAFKDAGVNGARVIDQSVLGLTVATVSTGAAISGGAVTLGFGDNARRFREGATYTWNDNGSRNANPFTCTSRDLDTGDVVFSTSATGTVVATDDKLEILHSSTDAAISNYWCSLEDAAGSGDIYNHTVASGIYGWSGVTVPAAADGYTAAISNSIIRELVADQFDLCEEEPDLFIVSSRMKKEMDELQISMVRIAAGGVLNPYPSKDFEEGQHGQQKLVVDPFMANDKVFSIVSDKVELLQFRDWSEYNEFTNDTATYQKILQLDAQFNLKVSSRKGVGMIHRLALS